MYVDAGAAGRRVRARRGDDARRPAAARSAPVARCDL